jgi:hypothetical protein
MRRSFCGTLDSANAGFRPDYQFSFRSAFLASCLIMSSSRSRRRSNAALLYPPNRRILGLPVGWLGEHLLYVRYADAVASAPHQWPVRQVFLRDQFRHDLVEMFLGKFRVGDPAFARGEIKPMLKPCWRLCILSVDGGSG